MRSWTGHVACGVEQTHRSSSSSPSKHRDQPGPDRHRHTRSKWGGPESHGSTTPRAPPALPSVTNPMGVGTAGPWHMTLARNHVSHEIYHWYKLLHKKGATGWVMKPLDRAGVPHPPHSLGQRLARLPYTGHPVGPQGGTTTAAELRQQHILLS